LFAHSHMSAAEQFSVIVNYVLKASQCGKIAQHWK
jgi:hypothetical protein